MSQKLTIALEGKVPLKEFSAAMLAFHELIKSLTEEMAPGLEILWEIDYLSAGSATATVLATYDDPRPLDRIAEAYRDVGKALSEHKAIPFAPRIVSAARDVVKVLDGNITEIVFETEDGDPIRVSSPYQGPSAEPAFSMAIGSIKGTVDTLKRRGHLGFTLYDSVFDRPIDCYLEPGHEDDVRGFWGKKIYVSGVIKRSADTGRPITVTNISDIRPVDSSSPGSFRKARGIFRLPRGESSETIVRKMRDEQ